MNLFLLTFSVFAPLIVCIGFVIPSWRSMLIKLSPLSALPALILSFSSPIPQIDLSWVLLGMTFSLDPTAKIFLFFTALLWGVSGVYAVSYVKNDLTSFFVCYLLAMYGNIGLVLSVDVASFYFFFGLMSFAAYGLIVHERNALSYYAGSVYISLVILSEVLIFSGIVINTDGIENLLFQDFTSILINHSNASLIVGLLVFGFGIKAGLFPLHVWLPLAHPAAPTPASAILSGAMIKAGLLGWIRFLPIGEVSIPIWGILLVILGLIGAYYAVIVGLAQDSPKAILAYSSVSQVGLMMVAVGTGLAVPEIWPFLWTALMIFAMQHAIAKGALFLSLGTAVSRGKAIWTVAFLFPAVALVGAPFTSGALAKGSLKTALNHGITSDPWIEAVNLLIAISAIGTFLLLARFYWKSVKHDPKRNVSAEVGIVLPWSLLVTVSILFPLFASWLGLSEVSFKEGVGANIIPFIIGGFILLIIMKMKFKPTYLIPAGDLLFVYIKVAKVIFLPLNGLIALSKRLKTKGREAFKIPKIDANGFFVIEELLGRWKVFGMTFLSLTLIIIFLISIFP